jgi:hypothetical protein
MAFVGIHRQIIEYGDLTCQYPLHDYMPCLFGISPIHCLNSSPIHR